MRAGPRPASPRRVAPPGGRARQHLVPVHPQAADGGLAHTAACGRRQPRMRVHAGRPAARGSDVSQVRARPAPAKAVRMKLGGAVGPGRAGLGPDRLVPKRPRAAANALDARRGPLPAVTLRTVAPRRLQRSAEVARRSTALSCLSLGSGPPQAAREASPARAHSRPDPWRRPARAPVARWPGLLKRSGFLTSRWIMPPGLPCPQRRAGSSGSGSLDPPPKTSPVAKRVKRHFRRLGSRVRRASSSPRSCVAAHGCSGGASRQRCA